MSVWWWSKKVLAVNDLFSLWNNLREGQSHYAKWLYAFLKNTLFRAWNNILLDTCLARTQPGFYLWHYVASQASPGIRSTGTGTSVPPGNSTGNPQSKAKVPCLVYFLCYSASVWIHIFFSFSLSVSCTTFTDLLGFCLVRNMILWMVLLWQGLPYARMRWGRHKTEFHDWL